MLLFFSGLHFHGSWSDPRIMSGGHQDFFFLLFFRGRSGVGSRAVSKLSRDGTGRVGSGQVRSYRVASGRAVSSRIVSGRVRRFSNLAGRDGLP